MKKLLLFCLAVSCCLLPLAGGSTEESVCDLSLLAINVRKADALLLRSGGSAYLIDTGSEDSTDALLNALRAEGISRLTGVILTHTDKDHTGGLEALLASEIRIDSIYASAFYKKKSESKHPAVKALKSAGSDMSVRFISAGEELPLEGGKLTAVGPLEKNEDAENCNSLVLLAEGGGGSMLLAGDMEFPEEDSLLKNGVLSRVDVLKVGNHGEGDATSSALISTLQPSLAVISTNTEDEPDTPDPRVLRLFAGLNIPVVVTQDAETGILVTLRNGEILTELK